MRRFPLALLILLACLGPRAAVAEPPLGALRALDDDESPGHEKAVDWWDELSEADKVGALRRALASEDAGLATLAARGLDPCLLDVAEMRRQATLLAVRPMALLTADWRPPWSIGGDVVAGSPDVVPFWTGITADPEADAGRLDSMHRVLRSRHVEGLLPLLSRGTPAVFERLLWHFAQCARYDREDHHRATIAHGFTYALARARAERAGAERPPLADAKPDLAEPEGGGLPPAFTRLARAFLRDAPDGLPASVVDAWPWLERWALTLTPAAADRPLLELLLVEFGKDGYTGIQPVLVRWVLRHLARFEDPAGIERVRALAAGEGDLAVYAAATLAERGEPARFEALLRASGDEGEGPQARVLGALQWVVDREQARERALRTIQAGGDSAVEPEERLTLDVYWGIDIGDDDLAWIENALWSRDASPLVLAAFHARELQGRIDAERSRVLLGLLKALPRVDWEKHDVERVASLFPTLHAQHPDALRDLLRTWMETQPGVREEVLLRLARLGDTAHVGAMLAAWPDWASLREGWVLGRVAHEHVAQFLRGHAAGDDAELATAALRALCVHAGLPAAVREVFLLLRDDLLGSEPFETARRLVIEGKALEGVLHMVTEDPGEPQVLGLIDDPRARAVLRRLQAERHHGLYLQATAGLALAGDAEARREFGAFLDDDRIWILSNVGEDLFRLFEPAYLERFFDRLDSNCCLGFEAAVRIKALYPSLPYDVGFGGAGTRRTRAWRDAVVWARSPLSEGLVPVRRAR